MWASKLRNQARMKSKINSIHWIDGTCQADGEDDANSNCCCGWMLFGGGSGELGVSWIGRRDSSCYGDKIASCTMSGTGSLYKSHFILRGHSGGVKFVRWKPQGDKLVSYDGWGNIRVWKNRSNVFASDFERTTVTPVSDIQWSPCGMHIALCGEEGQLQVISGHDGAVIFAIHAVSTNLFGSYAEFTSLSWNATSTRISLGTRKGEVIEVDPHRNGRFLTMMSMHENVPVRQVEYFGPVQFSWEPLHRRGGMERRDREGEERGAVPRDRGQGGDEDWMASQSLSVYMADGEVAIFPDVEETQCYCVHTRVVGGVTSWNRSQTLLAVVGYRHKSKTSSYLTVRFLNTGGHILMSLDPLLKLPLEPCNCHKFSLSSVCWGLRESAIFIAYGSSLFSVDVWQEVPSLKTLCRELINSNVRRESRIRQLPLPQREMMALCSLRPTLLTLPFDVSLCDQSLLHYRMEQLFSPPPHNQRLHCVLVIGFPEDDMPDHNGQNEELKYTLKYEHFGCCVPLLKATKKPRGFQRVGFDIMPGELLMGGNVNKGDFWASAPMSNHTLTHRRQRRRNSWSGSGSSSSSRLERLMRTVYRLRPRSTVLDAPLELGGGQEDQPQSHMNLGQTSGSVQDTSEGTHTPAGTRMPNIMHTSLVDEGDICPVIAQVNGNKLVNKFKILKCLSLQPEESPGPQDLLGVVKVHSHHIKCEPRDIGIRLYHGNETVPVTNLSSKRPEWNSRFGVYELDFGGRISRDSIKNLQVELNGEIVLQFGRSAFKDYCLDFQAPFSPVTAIGLALAAIHSS